MDPLWALKKGGDKQIDPLLLSLDLLQDLFTSSSIRRVFNTGLHGNDLRGILKKKKEKRGWYKKSQDSLRSPIYHGSSELYGGYKKWFRISRV